MNSRDVADALLTMYKWFKLESCYYKAARAASSHGLPQLATTVCIAALWQSIQRTRPGAESPSVRAETAYDGSLAAVQVYA